MAASSAAPSRTRRRRRSGGRGRPDVPPGTPLSQIPGVTPKDNPNPTETILYVNGIRRRRTGRPAACRRSRTRTGAKVIGVHNATEGMVADLAQCVKDKLDKGNNPAVDTLADTIYAELKAGR